MNNKIEIVEEKCKAYLKAPKDSPYYGNLFKDTLEIIEYIKKQSIIKQHEITS